MLRVLGHSIGDARSSDGSSYFLFSDDDILQGSFSGSNG
jgi:hypothetical protein